MGNIIIVLNNNFITKTRPYSETKGVFLFKNFLDIYILYEIHYI
jgi:hypothetical protein